MKASAEELFCPSVARHLANGLEVRELHSFLVTSEFRRAASSKIIRYPFIRPNFPTPLYKLRLRRLGLFCTKCGTDLPDDSQFCRKCGQSLGSAKSVSTGGGAAAAPTLAPTKSNPWVRAAITVLLVALLGWLVLYAVQQRPHIKYSSYTQSQPPVPSRSCIG